MCCATRGQGTLEHLVLNTPKGQPELCLPAPPSEPIILPELLLEGPMELTGDTLQVSGPEPFS